MLPLSSSIRTKDFLYIVLELVENGSLAAAIKRFGYFDEQLTAVYIAQVLRGLAYLVSSPGHVWDSYAAAVFTPVAPHPDVSHSRSTTTASFTEVRQPQSLRVLLG